MQRRAAEDLKQLVTDALVERGFALRGRAGLRDAAPPRAARRRPAGARPRRARGAQGPARRRARGGGAGLPQGAGPDLAVRGDDRARSEEGRVLRRRRSSGRAGRRRRCWPRSCPPSSAPSPGRNPCAGARPPRTPGRCAGCARCTSIVCTFGPETEDAGDRAASRSTASRPATSPTATASWRPAPIRCAASTITSPALERAKVVLDADRRKDIILHDARDLAFAQGLDLVEDEGLLEEVAGLVEWPVVLMGAFEERFLDIPPEADPRHHPRQPEMLRAARRARRRASRTASSWSRTSSRRDGGATIVAGNERVVRARLSDAKFFWETDKKRSGSKARARPKLDEHRLPREARHAGRARRAHRGAGARTGAGGRRRSGSRRARGAARQGRSRHRDGRRVPGTAGPDGPLLRGRCKASTRRVAAAIEEHYKPLGPSDRVPTDPVSVAVALADKLDTLVGFWAIDEKPTGSKDPYALRRAALGVIRSCSRTSASSRS